jgi:hypothetical protein
MQEENKTKKSYKGKINYTRKSIDNFRFGIPKKKPKQNKADNCQKPQTKTNKEQNQKQ